MAAVEKGNLNGLLDLLTEDATLVPDGGGVRGAAIRILYGREAVAQFILGIQRQMPENTYYTLAQINGKQAVVIRREDKRPYAVISFDVHHGKAIRLYAIAGDTKLRNV